MEESEVVDLLDDLEEMLAELGLGSIVEQERTTAREGRVLETTRDDLPRRRTKGQAQREVGDVQRVPLSERERIAILIDLAEVAVGATFALEERVLDFVDENFPVVDGQPPRIFFRSDRSEGFVLEDDRDWSLPDRDALNARRNDVRQVLADLERLRDLAQVERTPDLSISRESRDPASDRMLGWA